MKMKFAVPVVAALALFAVMPDKAQARDRFDISVGFGYSNYSRGSRNYVSSNYGYSRGRDYGYSSYRAPRYSSPRYYSPRPVYRDSYYYRPTPRYYVESYEYAYRPVYRYDRDYDYGYCD